MNEVKLLGKKQYCEAIDLAERYKKISDDNEKSAKILEINGMYSEAAYMYIQSMEKRMKAYICNKINVGIPYYAEKLRSTGHSLEKSADLLLEIYTAGNELVKNQMYMQLMQIVCENQRYDILNNSLRYPFYEKKKKNYSYLSLSQNDCIRLSKINDRLKKFLNDVLCRL